MITFADEPSTDKGSWVQCDRCDEFFEPGGMTVSSKGGKTVYHYICPYCGYHGVDEHMTDEPKKEEEIDMSNYYTVVNAASRLNCNRQTVLRAIKDGTFTDAIRDYSIPGHPAWMVPSEQVEWWKDHGGILKRRSIKTGQMAGGVAKMLVHKPEEETEELIAMKEKEIQKKLDEQAHLSLGEVMDSLGLEPAPSFFSEGWAQSPEDTGKILIEIDASTIQKSVSERFRKQVANLREAVSMIQDELTKLEQML